MYFSRSAAIGAALLFALPAAAQEVTPDTVVATVNGVEITAGHMVAAKGRLPDQYRQLADDVLFSGLLDQLIQQESLSKDHSGLTAASQYVLDNETRALKAGEVLQDHVDELLTEDAIKAAYDEEFAGGEPEEEFNASHILVETEEEAAEIVDQLSNGADFATLAREKSTGPSGPNGGELGWFGKGQMVPEFEATVLELEPGDVSAPVQTQFGWHVVILNDKRLKDIPDLEAVRQQIVGRLQQEVVEALLAEVTEGSEITRADTDGIDPTFLSNPDFIAN